MNKPRSPRDHLNPKQVIEDSLPELLIPPKNQTVQASSLTEVFKGHMGPWIDFIDEMTDFHRHGALQQAFKDCVHVKADDNLSLLEQESPSFAGLEHVQIGEERDLHGCFLANVVGPVLSTLRTIMRPEHVQQAHIDAAEKIPLMKDVSAGSAKTVPIHLRKQHEPDIVFKMPGSGDHQMVRIVGELKFPRTCQIQKAWEQPGTYDYGGQRHILGQVARDMREHGARFGFVSTYDWTAFLKIHKREDGDYVLLYSKPIRFSESLRDDIKDGFLSVVNVRFAMLYLIHRASLDDSWSFDPADIVQEEWTVTGSRTAGPGEQVIPSPSPYKDYLKVTPDDPRDLTYVDSPDNTPSRVTALINDFDIADDEEDISATGPLRRFRMQPAQGITEASNPAYRTRSRNARHATTR